MLELSHTKMQFIGCGVIWSKSRSVEVYVDTWDYNYRIHLMTLDIDKMDLTKIILIVWLDVLNTFLLCNEHNNFSIILHTCLINLLNQHSDIFTCYLVLFQVIDGRLLKVFRIKASNTLIKMMNITTKFRLIVI